RSCTTFCSRGIQPEGVLGRLLHIGESFLAVNRHRNRAMLKFPLPWRRLPRGRWRSFFSRTGGFARGAEKVLHHGPPMLGQNCFWVKLPAPMRLVEHFHPHTPAI